MKTTISNLKQLLSNILEAGHVDRSRRKAHGYDEDNADVDYLDRANENIEITEDPGVSQSKRLAHGYGLEEPADYDVPGEGLPPKEEDIFALRARNHEPPALKAMNPLPPVDVTDAEDEMEDECMTMGEAGGCPHGHPDPMFCPECPEQEKPQAKPETKKESRMPPLASVLLPPKKKSK